MFRELLKEMERRTDLDYFGLRSCLPQSRRSRRAAVKARAHFAGAGVGVSSATVDAKSPGPSRVIWGQFGAGNVKEDPGLGHYFYDNFASFWGTVTSKVGTYSGDPGGYKSFEETSGSIKQLNTLPVNTTVPGTQTVGEIELATAASVSNTIAMEAGGGNGGSFGLTGNVMPALFFEARVKINLATISGLDTFIGLCEKGGAASQFLISSSDAMNQKSQIGFWGLTAGATGKTINAGYGKNAQAAVIPTVANAAAYVAQTYTKLGFVYDPRQPGNPLKFFQDGTLVTSVADCSASTFPSAVALTPLIVCQSDASAASVVKFDMDWWAAGILFN